MNVVNLARANWILLGWFLTCAPAWAQRPLGIDVYSGSGTITWPTVAANSYYFAYTKATQSTNYEDPPMAYNMLNAKAAGVVIGCYDFAIPGSNTPSMEATYFWNYAGAYIKNDGRSLMPMLDFETFNGFKGATSYADWVNQWCEDIQTNAAAHGFSVTPVIYISACNACDLDSSVSGWRDWIADYNGESYTNGTAWSTCTSCEQWGSGFWQLWQFTSSETVPGVPGNGSGYCDVDTYNGTLAGFYTNFIVGGIAITNEPTNLMVNLGSSATFRVKASGTGPLYYQWRLNQANISNATTAALTITNAQLSAAGGYSVAISNTTGIVISSPAFLSVMAPLTNAFGAILAPTNIINWWTADGNPVDIFGTNDLVPNNNFAYTNGKQGLAFRFDGSSAYLLPAGGMTNLPPSWTLCLWVNRQNAPTASASLMGDSTYAVKLEQYDATREIGLTHSGVADYVFKISVPQNKWMHVALVDSGSTISLYTNGVFASSTLYSNNVAIVTPSGFPLPRACFGADELANGAQTDFMLGSLDEILTFHRALGAGEIAGIYAAGSAGLVRAPQFAGVTVNGNGTTQLTVKGMTGKNITLYGSTNLVNWSSLGAISNPTGAVQYLDSAALPYRFYRATQPQP